MNSNKFKIDTFVELDRMEEVLRQALLDDPDDEITAKMFERVRFALENGGFDE